jgi:hypothetical protein
MAVTKFITQAKARKRVSEALLLRHTERIIRPTKNDVELLERYGNGPSYQPGTRYLGGDGYNPYLEIEAGGDHSALLRAQQRHRDWQWHCEQVDGWLEARFDGARYDRATFEDELAASFGRISAASQAVELSEDDLLASLPDNREKTADLIRLPDQIPNTDQSEAAMRAMRSIWPKGVPSVKKTSEVTRRVNVWIGKQPRGNVPVERVSAETIARLLGRKGRGWEIRRPTSA